MSGNFCKKCGHKQEIGNNYCPNCGSHVVSLFPLMSHRDMEVSSTSEREVCPKCKGSGKMDSTDSIFGLLGAIFTAGMSVLAVDAAGGGITCDRCNGKGYV